MEELNAKKEEELNAKKEVELNAMEEGKLPVRWGRLGEEEEEGNSVGTLKIPTASELFSLRSRRNKKGERRRKEEGEEEEED